MEIHLRRRSYQPKVDRRHVAKRFVPLWLHRRKTLARMICRLSSFSHTLSIF
jgi:hypothetical protein